MEEMKLSSKLTSFNQAHYTHFLDEVTVLGVVLADSTSFAICMVFASSGMVITE